MSKQSFFKLISLIEDNPIFHSNSNHTQAHVAIQLAVTLERLGCDGNGVSVGRVARNFGVASGTVVLFTRRIVSAINALTHLYIKWPGPSERKLISRRIYENYNIPDCVGIVDGTHFIIKDQPTIDGAIYWTRKQRYALNAQIVCDDRLQIRALYTGWPGTQEKSKTVSFGA